MNLATTKAKQEIAPAKHAGWTEAYKDGVGKMHLISRPIVQKKKEQLRTYILSNVVICGSPMEEHVAYGASLTETWWKDRELFKLNFH